MHTNTHTHTHTHTHHVNKSTFMGTFLSANSQSNARMHSACNATYNTVLHEALQSTLTQTNLTFSATYCSSLLLFSKLRCTHDKKLTSFALRTTSLGMESCVLLPAAFSRSVASCWNCTKQNCPPSAAILKAYNNVIRTGGGVATAFEIAFFTRGNSVRCTIGEALQQIGDQPPRTPSSTTLSKYQ